MSANTLNKGGRIARASVISKLRRTMKQLVESDAKASSKALALATIEQLVTWVNFSASRYKKRPGGLK